MRNVVILTMTEFGRCAMENGSGGVDHGFGQASLVMGGGVAGGSVYGTWPGLGEEDLIDNDLRATTDYRIIVTSLTSFQQGPFTLTVREQ